MKKAIPMSRRHSERAVHGTASRVSFIADFTALDASLQRERREGRSIMTPERMIIELGLTPKRVAAIESKFGIKFPWLGPAYLALRRHGLLKRNISWGKWLNEYRRMRRRLGRARQGPGPVSDIEAFIRERKSRSPKAWAGFEHRYRKAVGAELRAAKEPHHG